MSVLEKRNNALDANPNMFTYPAMSDINITERGSDWYWAVTAIMAASTFAILGLSMTRKRSDRVFHYITASITLVAAIAYFTMASNLGYAAIPVEFQRSSSKVAGVYREIFYVRYIDWFITTPLLLMDVLLTAGLPWPTILYTILLDEVMVVCGLVGALVASSYKWGYFIFAMFALFGIAYNVLWVGRLHAKHIGTGTAYQTCAAWTIFLWFLYPIAWGISEGGNVIAPDSEAIFYGILDILAKPGFGALLLWGHRNIDPKVLGLHIRDYDDPISIHKGINDQHNGTTSAVTGNNTTNASSQPPVAQVGHTSPATGTTTGTQVNQSVV